MGATIFQCCYTNASRNRGGVTTSGWQPVAVSKDVPADALESCVKLQSVNSNIQGRMLDEDGNILDLYEVTGSQDYVFVMRTRYGLSDQFGRANMFSHAYIIPWVDGALKDANEFLGIYDESFCADEGSALEAVGNVLRTNRVTLQDALSDAGISKESYLVLMQCVIARLTDRSLQSPLYVQYSGSGTEMRSILYAIYEGLPYYLRKKLAIASCSSLHTDTKTIIFSKYTQTKHGYVNPLTGENDVLTRRMVSRISRFKYLDYAVRNVGELDADAYFDALEAKAVELGDKTASDPLILRTAHQIITEFDYSSLDDADFADELGDVLMASTVGNKAMESLLTKLLDMAVERDLSLSQATESDLISKLASAETDCFSEAGERYLIHRFSAIPEEDAAERLFAMSTDMRERYLRQLLETERGRHIVDRYYSIAVNRIEDTSWESLTQVAVDSSTMDVRPLTCNALDAAASALYESSLGDAVRAAQSYQNYVTFLRLLFTDRQVEACGRSAKEAFWDGLFLESFNPEQRDAYAQLSDGSFVAQDALALSSIVLLLDEPDEERYIGSSWRFLRRENLAIASPEKTLSYLRDAVLRRYKGNDGRLSDWVEVIAHAEDERSAMQLINLRRSVVAGNEHEAMNSLAELVNEARQGSVKQNEVSSAAVIALDYLMRMDESIPLALDSLLILGEALNIRQPYAIFDTYKPFVLQMEPEDVIRGSRLSLDSSSATREEIGIRARYISLGEEYIRSHGSEAKAVKRWIVSAKKATKDSDFGSGFVGAVGGLINRASRFGRDTQPNEERRLQKRRRND